jgi:hypothetical protein
MLRTYSDYLREPVVEAVTSGREAAELFGIAPRSNGCSGCARPQVWPRSPQRQYLPLGEEHGGPPCAGGMSVPITVRSSASGGSDLMARPRWWWRGAGDRYDLGD